MVAMALWLSALALFVLPAAARAAGNVYVANVGSANVSQYAIGVGGALVPLNPATVPAGSGAFGVAVSPDGRSAYVGGDAAISQYDIDPVTGALSPKTPSTVATPVAAGAIAVSPNGKSAYVVNADTVSQYDIDPLSGRLSPKAPPTVPTSPAPHAIAVSPDGRSAYVANYVGNRVSQYDIDPSSGRLLPKTPATVAAGFLPTGVAVSPDGKSAYVTNQGHLAGPGDAGHTVSQYDIDPVTGGLSPKMPATVSAGSFPWSVAVTPDGRNAYVADIRGSGVSQYDIDSLTGGLSPKIPPVIGISGPNELGAEPDAIAVSADGENAYVSDDNGDNVAQFDIGTGGSLSPKSPFTVPTGRFPDAIAVTPLLRVPTSKDQCKNGGWRNFPQFRNQGQCVAFVERGPKS
jgi:DNA-binding beta-propeller fold protein YncE